LASDNKFLNAVGQTINFCFALFSFDLEPNQSVQFLAVSRMS